MDFAAGMSHVLMLNSDGTAFGQGGNMRDQLGPGGVYKDDGLKIFIYESYGNSIIQAKQFELPEPITRVGAGRFQSVFLARIIALQDNPSLGSGTVYMIRGLRIKAKTEEENSRAGKLMALKMPNREKVAQIAVGDHHVLMLTGTMRS